MNCKQIVIALISCVFVCMSVYASPWKIHKSQDEITDEISYYVYSTGSRIDVFPSVSYRPDLVIKIFPKSVTRSNGLSYVADVMLSIENDGLTRNQTEIITRYNRQPASTETWTTSTDRRAAFAPNWKSTLKKIIAATNLTVRYQTTLGHIRTATFDVSGLTNALKQVKSQYLAERK